MIKEADAGSKCSVPFQSQRNALTTADAQGCESLPGVALEHLVNQGNQNATARRTYWVTESNCTAIHIGLAHVPAKLSIN
ncbi:hypothetical protein D9M68_933300 [compost metagenome]